jgi:hypothetical protein
MTTEEKYQSWNVFRSWLMRKLNPSKVIGEVGVLIGTHYEGIGIIYRAFGAKIGKRVC